MAVSREHLTLPKQLGLKHLVVFINKCDAAYEEMIELLDMEIRELLEEMGGFILSKGLPSVLLRTQSPSWGWRPSTSSLIEGVEDQTIPDRGCLITGMLEQGKLKVGQEVEVLGYN
jgi:elongation factor Tu